MPRKKASTRAPAARDPELAALIRAYHETQAEADRLQDLCQDADVRFEAAWDALTAALIDRSDDDGEHRCFAYRGKVYSLHRLSGETKGGEPAYRASYDEPVPIID